MGSESFGTVVLSHLRAARMGSETAVLIPSFPARTSFHTARYSSYPSLCSLRPFLPMDALSPRPLSLISLFVLFLATPSLLYALYAHIRP